MNKTLMSPVDELMVRMFRPLHVLIVQDDPSFIERLLLHSYDCKVATTTSGQEAVRLLTGQKFDLVLLDLALLNGTSQTVLRAVSEHAPDVPVVATKVTKASLETILNGTSPVTLLNEPVTASVLQHLFRVFKLKARTHAIAEYCAARQPSLATGLAV